MIFIGLLTEMIIEVGVSQGEGFLSSIEYNGVEK